MSDAGIDGGSRGGDGTVRRRLGRQPAWLPDNPLVRFFESRQRGYVSVELTAERLTAHLRTVSDVRDPRATLSTLRSFVVESGWPGAGPA